MFLARKLKYTSILWVFVTTQISFLQNLHPHFCFCFYIGGYCAVFPSLRFSPHCLAKGLIIDQKYLLFDTVVKPFPNILQPFSNLFPNFLKQIQRLPPFDAKTVHGCVKTKRPFKSIQTKIIARLFAVIILISLIFHHSIS